MCFELKIQEKSLKEMKPICSLVNWGQVENSETSEISKKFFQEFQIRVFNFGCRTKSKTQK